MTSFGGELLANEVAVVPGKGKLIVTGKLGSVMQESAQAAMSYVRARSAVFGLEPDFYSKIDVHIHFPEGAIPKDGPSAGVTMVTSLVSALLKLPVTLVLDLIHVIEYLWTARLRRVLDHAARQRVPHPRRPGRGRRAPLSRTRRGPRRTRDRGDLDGHVRARR